MADYARIYGISTWNHDQIKGHAEEIISDLAKTVISENPIMSFWKKFWKRRTNKLKRGFRAKHNKGRALDPRKMLTHFSAYNLLCQ